MWGSCLDRRIKTYTSKTNCEAALLGGQYRPRDRESHVMKKIGTNKTTRKEDNDKMDRTMTLSWQGTHAPSSNSQTRMERWSPEQWSFKTFNFKFLSPSSHLKCVQLLGIVCFQVRASRRRLRYLILSSTFSWKQCLLSSTLVILNWMITCSYWSRRPSVSIPSFIYDHTKRNKQNHILDLFCPTFNVRDKNFFKIRDIDIWPLFRRAISCCALCSPHLMPLWPFQCRTDRATPKLFIQIVTGHMSPSNFSFLYDVHLNSAA